MSNKKGTNGYQKKRRWPIYTAVILFVLILLIAVSWQGLKAVNNFFENYSLKFNKIVQVKFNEPLTLVKRDKKPKVITKIKVFEYPDAIDTPIEKYICDKWGVYDCKNALAIFKAESGLREEAFNINTNGTIDVGIAQINSIHFKKKSCSLKEIVDAYKNIDCAYQIFKASGWNPWVTYQNGNFISLLE